MLGRGYVCVGWDEVGDLRDFENFDQFQSRFRSVFEKDVPLGYGTTPAGKATATRKAKEVWSLRDLEVGTVVLANRGISEIVGVGEVLDPGYEFSEQRQDHRHILRVKWETTQARQIPTQKKWAFMTVAPVSLADYERFMRSDPEALRPDKPTVRVVAAPLDVELAQLLEERKQLILYGPPGTGKTYTARRFLLYWLLSKAGKESSEILADPERTKAAWAALARSSEGDVAQATTLTFHPSYSYEDFVEGYRPRKANDGGLKLDLEPGVFKRVCREAQKNLDRPFVVFIDEINRANLPKVFGELITVIEADKRGMEVTLPQSKEAFSIPPNVYIIGTMNTADRSIKVLDVAFRRRFAFHELMPEPSLLAGVQFGDLALDDFLEFLNGKIRKKEGREKQIGHAVFFVGDEPISEIEEFARRIRHEVIPLLQEYCYEDYGALADYLGPELVFEDSQRLNVEILQQPEALVAALARIVNKPGEGA